MIYNQSKRAKKPQNSAPNHKDEHFIDAPNSDNETASELLTGYLYSDGKLFGFSGLHDKGRLKIRKIPMGLTDENAIMQWCAYLKQMDSERDWPTSFDGLWDTPDDDASHAHNGQKTGNVFNYKQWRQAQEAKGGDSYRFYRTGFNIGSEVRTHLDGTDLLLECRFTLPCCKHHVREDGITNFLAHVIQSLTSKASAQLIEMLIEKGEEKNGPEDTPIVL